MPFESIQINGHTDDIPLSGNGQFTSNWDLSAVRAIAVVSLFRKKSNEDKVLVPLLSATGYSKHRPVVLNDSELNRARNRRIEILLLYSEEKDK